MTSDSVGADSSTDPKPWTRHIPALDGVRGMAILLVLAHNFNLLEGSEAGVAKLVGLLLNWGWVGVQLFFVLSGYLITNILLSTREGPRYFSSFFGRRAVRIFPLYYISLAVGLILVPLVTGSKMAGSEHQIWLWTYLSNWAGPLGYEVHYYPHMWSLAVEEQFYLVWPFVVYFMSRRGLMRLCIGLTVVALLARVGIRVMDGATEAAYQFTICRMDALALGAMVAIVNRNPALRGVVGRRRSSLRLGLVVATLATVVLTRGAPRVGILTQSYGYSLLAIIFALFILDIVVSTRDGQSDWLTKLLSFAALRKIGTYSYAMYVIHKPAHHLLGVPVLKALGMADSSSMVIALLYFGSLSAAVFAMAFLSYHLIERHFLSLKRHLVAS